MRNRVITTLCLVFVTAPALTAQNPAANPIGVACPGTNGAPNLAASQAPYIRESITFSLTNLPTVPGFVILVFGTDDLMWNGRALPADLGFTGMPGCNIYVAPEAIAFEPHALPSHSVRYFVPDRNFLVGCRILCQALVCDSRVGNPLGGTTTNALELVIGSR